MTRFLLSERNNPHAPLRANGRRWWGYPSRSGGTAAIRVIAIHTTENAPSPAVALNVARWQATTAPGPSSYHVIVDSDHTVRTVLDEHTAFHIANFNTASLGLSFGTRAALWGRYPEWDELALERGAAQVREWLDLYDIPLRWLTRAQALAGQRGLVRHSVMDPSRRTDPGGAFPAARFFRFIEEDDMTPEDRALLQQVAKDVGDIKASLGGRNVGGDLQRIRLSQRPIARAVGAPVWDATDGPAPLDGSHVVS